MNSVFDTAARTALTNCIREIEKRTDAELVLVVRARSHSYAAANYLFGALLAFAGLNFLLFSPFSFHEFWVPIDVALLFVLGAFVSARSNAISRWLTRKSVRDKSVRTGAAECFMKRASQTQKLRWACLYTFPCSSEDWN